MNFIYKITLLLFLVSISGYSQTKSTPVISFNTDMTAQFTLNNVTSKVTLVLTGPSANWSSLGIGTSASTSSGDVFVYTTSVTAPTPTSTSPNEDWSIVSNLVSSNVRTVTLERVLSNSDLNDLQLAFDATNSIDIVWSLSGSAIATAPNPNRGNTTAAFSATLGIDDAVLNNEVQLYPNPTSGELYIKTNTNLTKIKVYSQTGALVETINIKDNSNEIKVNVNHLPKALYIFELQNNFEKTWKKVIVN